MFREIRKKRNMISDEEIQYLLCHARRGVLSVHGDHGYPYAIPMNYLYDCDEQCIYFHSSRIGHKVDALNVSDKVCFTVIGDALYDAEDWAPFVKSVVVFGRCYPIHDPELALKALTRFAMKYYPSEEMALNEVAVSGKAVQMFMLQIEHLSGKKIQEK